MAKNIFLYEIPENWQWVKLGTLTRNQYGYTAKATKNNSLPKMLRITDIQNGFVDWETVPNCDIDDEQKEKYILKNDDIVIARTGATTGKSYLVKSPSNSVFASYLVRLQVIKIVDVTYIYYFLQSNVYWSQISELSAGIAQPGVNSTKLKNLLIPLPPIDEQKRIVAIIESLFGKLDAAKSIVQKIIDGYEPRRAAILHKAFIGELTKNFRSDSGLTLDDWQQKKLGEVCKKFVYGTSKKSKPVGKIIVIRMGNLQGGEIDWKNLAYSDDEEDIEKYKLSAGDVLFNRTNSAELVGKTSIYRGEYPAIYAGYLIKLDYEKNFLDGEYLNFILNSPEAKIYCDSVKSNAVNQSNINAKKISGFEIPLPPLDEQKEIVRVLDSLLDKEQRTKEIAEKILSEIDLLKRTILARAFRGELGTNNPSEKLEGL